MKSAFIITFQISSKPRDPEKALDQLLRILDLVNQYRIHATWEIPEDDPGKIPESILAMVGQDVRSGKTEHASADVLVLKGAAPGWSVMDFIRSEKYLSQLDRAAKAQNIWRLRIDLRELDGPLCLDELQKIFGRFAWLRERDEMVSLNAAEWEQRWNQAVAGSSLTISPTKDLASPNNMSVRSM
ncbi:MAG: hypothetical protein LAO79_18910 [Acidobacteriia bacterium]|nr:hypothetical protein [Terriglobia bacterium]